MKPCLAVLAAFGFAGPALAAALLNDAPVTNHIHHGRQTAVRVDPDGIAYPVALANPLPVAGRADHQHCRLQRGRLLISDKTAKASPDAA
jgi:hypothetical protein